VLQTDSEHAGGAGSRFTKERLGRLIRSYLSSEGFENEDLSERVGELMQLATNRLVLLSEQVEGTISFDVRSLQEFMAAAAITSSDQKIMDSRLAHIAGHSHWRHVFQIAASRCFADDSFHYRRATITQITRQMDASEPDMVARNGARLALDLLADGVAFDHPNFRRPLLQHALEQLDLGVSVLDDRLAKVCDEGVADLARDAICQKIAEGNHESALCAWKLLFQISQLGQNWADDLIVQLWPMDGAVDVDIWENIALPLGSQRIADHLADSLTKSGPILGMVVYGFAQRLTRLKRDERVDYTRLRQMNLSDLYTNEKAPNHIRVGLLQFDYPNVCETKLISIRSSFDRFKGKDFADDSWESVRRLEEFGRSPNKKTLAACLRAFCSTKLGLVSFWYRILPWPIATILRESTGADHLHGLASEVEEGGRGDVDQWLEAETRWRKVGLVESDLLAATEERWFDADVGKRGAPSWVESYNHRHSFSVACVRKLVKISQDVRNKRLKLLLADTSAMLIGSGMRRERWAEDDAEFAIETIANSRRRFAHLGVEFAMSLSPSFWSKRSVAAKLGTLLARADSFDVQHPAMREGLLEAAERDPSLVSLLYPAALTIALEDFESRGKLERLFSRTETLPDDSDPYPRLARAIVRLIDCPDVGLCLDEILEIDETSNLMSAVLSGELMPVDRRLTILTLLIKKLKERYSPHWRNCIPIARKVLDSRKSELTNLEVWSCLELPPESFGALLPQAEHITLGR
jgi:hypothetical protein